MAIIIDKSSEKRFVIHGVIICAVAIILGAVFFTLQRENGIQQDYAYIINIAGKQRMLSQLIAFSAYDYSVTSSSYSKELLSDSISQMNEAHLYLTTLASLSLAVRQLYFSSDHNTDAMVKSYIATAGAILSAQNKQDKTGMLNDLMLARNNVLVMLDDIVSQYQFESQAIARNQQYLQLFMLVFVLVLLLFESFFFIFPLFKKIGIYSYLASQDVLTGCHNRRYFLQLLRSEKQSFARHGRPFSLIMLDIDHFKVVNDNYGHPVGDKVIKLVGKTLAKAIRVNDHCGRIGGEEFGVLLVDTDAAQAVKVAEKLRLLIQQARLKNGNDDIRVTVSLGVCTYGTDAESNRSVSTIDDLIKRADMSLYTAKQAGRNRVHQWGH